MNKTLLFHWQAVDNSGGWQQGERLALNRQQVYLYLNDNQLSPLRIRLRGLYVTAGWQKAARITLMRQLATLLKAGMPLAASLNMLSHGQHKCWCLLLRQLAEQISQGNAFAQALRQWPVIFPPLFPALVQIGELTGQLDNCCQRLATQQERQQLLHKKVQKALRYPLFILLVAAATSAAMLLFVLPEFVAIYDNFDARLPAFTRAVMQLSEWLQLNGLWLILALVCLPTGWRYQQRRSPAMRLFLQRLILRLPLVATLWRGSILSQIFTTLSLTQQAGIPLAEGLKATAQTLPGGVWQQALQGLIQHIEAGQPLHRALQQHPLFTSLCYQLIKVGEEAGALDDMLSRLAGWHENQTLERAENLAAMLEPAMMVIVGGIIGTLVIAMYLPVFNLGAALG
ncbi:type IV pilin biogenesis protein [Erwinia sp. OLTSP20]|uniref:protein transport protein HofC n=1 Tax=unclassified Erwinia TaxID=2622719 RepID=UPI000C17CBCB|nr:MULTISPECIES: protein transport protein HofC [unclassified Erwinia]PIJ49764.1 type IV pilin biogenesis protein [Erwinia sp. OAMSP11]PIJ70863.1 type IV pilin biogenesis protein [Erwinia sp. OLSSP12]PIJ80228.1 type IV pilin biogenesis protein [Erwinia sp. OLCASP19]PIJ82352.1 type IV pilin biogenesis protein [Erwinia sp. OLMTSP26]PIJ85038.1 type IV pilin biogenesis protein [Erwinia sp. OLMDSP33]